MSTSAPKLRNIGPKSAAWLRQVGLRSLEDVAAIGAVDAFMKVRRAGFKPSLNLLYSLEGALQDCHWQEVPESRRTELVQAAEAAIALLPPPRGRPAAGPVTTTQHEDTSMPAFGLFDDDRGGPNVSE
ncbi:TfoX/Sxy family protein [Thermomonas carbonis]|uniref:TfoX/Sxy family protein n=1 Tax=Thermomonas carbonis TaxID=1463158 RepID=A0A7G9SS01_9GAMM|nr:TfoX/Sxy family protein [Thermomonas carbonis]QNN70626.1 TfoX/Sxy family protein [Thermomonas carbonis]GHC01257.1 transcriptional regulator [Thermomonas carbonis]